MTEIARLESKVDQFRSLLEEEKRQHPEPDFAAELQMSSLRSQLTQLEEELRKAKEVRDREVIELRFFRDDIYGSLPLGTLGNVALNLSKAWHAVAHYVRSGGGGQTASIPEKIVGDLDLQFAGLGSGSARVWISGSLSPDLFGDSLLERSLHRTFDLLRAESNDELGEAVSRIGMRSMRRFRDVLDVLEDERYHLEMTWRSPRGETEEWSGSYQNIRQLQKQLHQFEVQEPETFKTVGTLYSASLGGQFTITSVDDEEKYEGRYPDNLKRKMKQLRVGQKVRARIQSVTYLNAALNIERIEYTLLDIKEAT